MNKRSKSETRMHYRIKKGDMVMVIAGGSGEKKPLKGKVGKVMRFAGRDRIIIEGVNMVIRNQRAAGPDKPGGQIEKEAPVHISNVMYYVEKLKMPVRIKYTTLADGRKVRGYLDPEKKEFVQIDT